MKKAIYMTETLFSELVAENETLHTRAQNAEASVNTLRQTMAALMNHLTAHATSCPTCLHLSAHDANCTLGGVVQQPILADWPNACG